MPSNSSLLKAITCFRHIEDDGSIDYQTSCTNPDLSENLQGPHSSQGYPQSLESSSPSTLTPENTVKSSSPRKKIERIVSSTRITRSVISLTKRESFDEGALESSWFGPSESSESFATEVQSAWFTDRPGYLANSFVLSKMGVTGNLLPTRLALSQTALKILQSSCAPPRFQVSGSDTKEMPSL